MFSKLENRLGSFRRSTSNLRRDASDTSIASTNYEPVAAPSPVSKRNRAKRREEMLNKLPEEYMQDQFDPVMFELSQLPTSFDEQMLDTIVDARASVLEVSSRHIHASSVCGHQRHRYAICRLLAKSCLCMSLPTTRSLCGASMKWHQLRKICRLVLYRLFDDNPMHASTRMLHVLWACIKHLATGCVHRLDWPIQV